MLRDLVASMCMAQSTNSPLAIFVPENQPFPMSLTSFRNWPGSRGIWVESDESTTQVEEGYSTRRLHHGEESVV